MTHEGRMARGKANVDSKSKKLKNNKDTLYYIENEAIVLKKEEKPKKEVKKKDAK